MTISSCPVVHFIVLRVALYEFLSIVRVFAPIVVIVSPLVCQPILTVVIVKTELHP